MVRPSPTLGVLVAVACLLGATTPALAQDVQGPHVHVDVNPNTIAVAVEVPVEAMVARAPDEAVSALQRLVSMHPRDAWVEVERHCSRFLRTTRLTVGGQALPWSRVSCPQTDMVLDLAHKRLADADATPGLLRISAQADPPSDTSGLTLTLPPSVASLPVAVDGTDRGLVGAGESVALLSDTPGS